MNGQVLEGKNDSYRVGKREGHGGVGIVYQGQAMSDGRRCAIKMLRPQRVDLTEMQRRRFIQETTLLCNHIDSPYIVKGLDGVKKDANLFLVMEWLDGGHLLRRVSDRDYDNDQLVRWICQLLKSFRDLRQYDVCHRDIKPNNVLLDSKDNLKLADFGIATLTDKELYMTMTGDLMGSLMYISPGQRAHPGKVTHRDDFFSLCVMFSELITGMRAWPHSPNLLQLRPNTVPPTFTRLVHKGLQYAVDWDDTYAQMCDTFDLDAEVLSADVSTEHWPVYVRPALRILHLVYARDQYGGIETYIDAIQSHSRHIHSVKSVFEFGRGSYPTEAFAFKYSSQRAIEELKLENRSHDYLGSTIRRTLEFLSTAEIPSDELGEQQSVIAELQERTQAIAGFDVVHAHFLYPAYFAQAKDMVTVCTSHSLLSQEVSHGSATVSATTRMRIQECEADERTSCNAVENLMALSESHRMELAAVGGAHAKLMHRLFDSTEFEKPEVKHLDCSEARERMRLPEKQTVLFIGRPAYRKRLDLLLDAMDRLKNNDVQLLIVGKGFAVDAINSTISYDGQEIHLTSSLKAKVLPPLEVTLRREIVLAYKAADIVVCPSSYEPFGYVNIEAMAAGRPVVSSNVDGIPEVIRDGSDGLLFRPGDADDLRLKMELLLNDDELRRRLGRQAYERARETYSLKGPIEHLDRYYEEVLARAQQPQSP